mmetsp:Transcript_8250/g.21651  ORF Transcript_8250/g.21651 Transcript_8250/m.21651 type:complete len:202 (+) Transcript_8250:246-851(+)
MASNGGREAISIRLRSLARTTCLASSTPRRTSALRVRRQIGRSALPCTQQRTLCSQVGWTMQLRCGRSRVANSRRKRRSLSTMATSPPCALRTTETNTSAPVAMPTPATLILRRPPPSPASAATRRMRRACAFLPVTRDTNSSLLARATRRFVCGTSDPANRRTSSHPQASSTHAPCSRWSVALSRQAVCRTRRFSGTSVR